MILLTSIEFVRIAGRLRGVGMLSALEFAWRSLLKSLGFTVGLVTLRAQ